MSRRRPLGDALHSAVSSPIAVPPRRAARGARVIMPVLGLGTLAAVGIALVLHFFVFASDSSDNPSSFAALQPAGLGADCDTDEQCVLKCAAHDTLACRHLAAIRMPKRNYPDFERMACDLGDGHSCAVYSSYWASSRAGRTADPEQAARYQARSQELEQLHCENGDAVSCWDYVIDQSARSNDCRYCDVARERACSLGLVVACSSPHHDDTAEAKETAWRTGISIVIGTCDRDRGLNILCTRAIANMTGVWLAPDDDERRRARRAVSVLAQRLGASLESRCVTSIDACLGYALLESRRDPVTNDQGPNGRVMRTIERFARECNERKPEQCLGLAFVLGGRLGLSDEVGLEGFNRYHDLDRARHAGLRACGLARARDRRDSWPVECDFILSRMSASEVAEALATDEYTR